MNNKGFTLIELMISVSLVSIVLIFTLNLLNDVRAEEDLGSNKTADLTNRTIITKVVQGDLDNHVVYSFGSDGSGAASLCDISANFFRDYDIKVNKCLYIRLDDGCRAIMLASPRTGENRNRVEYFVYGRKYGQTCTQGSVNEWTIEKWRLSSAVYDKIVIDATTNAVENNFQNTLAGNLANYAVMIKIPTKLADEYATTSMNFDLEFIYYTTDVNASIPGTTTKIFNDTTSYSKQIKGIPRVPYEI